MSLDPLGLGAVVDALKAIHATLDFGSRMHGLLWSGFADGARVSDFLLQTGNRGSRTPFITDSTVQAVLPYTTRIANAALTLAAIYASGRLMWGHGMFTRYTVRTMFPRLLLAVFLVNYCGPLFQAAVDMNNALSTTAMHATMAGVDLPAAMKRWADDAWSGPGLGPSVGVLLVVGYLLLGVGYVVRYALLVVLVLLAPLAAVMTILEETHKYSKEWIALTVTTLFMQPLQLFILGIGVNFEAGATSDLPVRHGFALASLWMAYKVPGALHAASGTGSKAISAGKHMAHRLTHAPVHHAAAHPRVPPVSRGAASIL